jgi:hypothetical protein
MFALIFILLALGFASFAVIGALLLLAFVLAAVAAIGALTIVAAVVGGIASGLRHPQGTPRTSDVYVPNYQQSKRW